MKIIADMALRAANFGLRLAIPVGRRLSRRRIAKGRVRTMWGVTPIVTLPLKARCDRLLGFRSESVVNTTYYITRDFTWNLRVPIGIGRRTGMLAAVDRVLLAVALLRYDVFHTFNDRGILSAHLAISPAELDATRAAGKRHYIYTYGADIRTRARTLDLGRWNYCAECPDPGQFCVCDDARGQAALAGVAERATAIVTMADMTAYAPDAVNLHYWPIDTERLAYVGVVGPAARPLRIAHAPNHQHFKGTHYLEAAIARLRAAGHEIELVRVQGIPNSEVMGIFAEADIVADQFIGGAYGYTALEAMARGKPVLCYVRDASIVMEPDACPILQADPDTIEQVLAWCLANRSALAAIGLQGRRYVERHHALPAVAARLARLYVETAGFPADLNRRLEAFIAGELTRAAAVPDAAGWRHPFAIPAAPAGATRPMLAAGRLRP